MSAGLHRFFSFVVVLGLTSLLSACSSKEATRIEYYRPAYRTSPPAPVYSRMMWGNSPQPIKPRAKSHAPLIVPVVYFDMPDASFEEAIEALAQTMGYRWDYPKRIAKRKIRVRMEGTILEVLDEISRQAGVHAELDHQQRLVRVIDKSLRPKLPGKW